LANEDVGHIITKRMKSVTYYAEASNHYPQTMLSMENCAVLAQS